MKTQKNDPLLAYALAQREARLNADFARGKELREHEEKMRGGRWAPWCSERILSKAALRLHVAAEALHAAGLTHDASFSPEYSGSGGEPWGNRNIHIEPGKGRMFIWMRLPEGAEPEAGEDVSRLTVPLRRGPIARLRRLLWGEERFVEGFALQALDAMARLEGEHCSARGIPPAAGAQALCERSDLGRGTPEPETAMGGRPALRPGL